jgi:hypothetical protein
MSGNLLYKNLAKNHALRFSIFSKPISQLFTLALFNAHEGLRDFSIAQSITSNVSKKIDEKSLILSVRSLSVQNSSNLKSFSTLTIRIGVRGVPSPIATSGQTGINFTNFCNLYTSGEFNLFPS